MGGELVVGAGSLPGNSPLLRSIFHVMMIVECVWARAVVNRQRRVGQWMGFEACVKRLCAARRGSM
jgi:hypothetical protein